LPVAVKILELLPMFRKYVRSCEKEKDEPSSVYYASVKRAVNDVLFPVGSFSKQVH
jgi:hypothetical protein